MLNEPLLHTREAALLLGLAQNTSGSEFQAGLRAELTPSPLTKALTSMRSQIAAQTMIALFRYKEAWNFAGARIPVLTHIIQQTITVNALNPVIVEPATGFASLAIELAERMPESTVIEIDLPEAMRARRYRLQQAGISIPENLQSVEANLRVTPLHEILNGEQIDTINFTGAFFTPDQLRTTLAYLHSLLNPGGAVVCYLPWMQGIEAIRFAARFFRRQVGEYPGMMENTDQIKAVFHDAGFDDVMIYYPSEVADELGLPTPILDVEVLVMARK